MIKSLVSIFFLGFVFLLPWLGAEVFFRAKGAPASFDSAYRQDPLLEALLLGESMQAHPFFGYHRSFKIRQIENLKEDGAQGKYIVLLTGGSLAEKFGDSVAAGFPQKLREQIPALRGKDIRFINLATGAFKQPQQFFLTTYLIDQADLVINLDGYNDVSMAADLEERSYKPAEYPSYTFRFFSPAKGDRRYLRLARGIRFLYRQMNALPLKFPWVASSFAYFEAWKALRGLFYRSFRNLENLYLRSVAEEIYSERRSLTKPNVTEKISSWKKYLSFTDTLVKARKKRFFSFVQPNQYFAGSKPLSSEEKSSAWEAGREQADRDSFPLLHKAAVDLNQRGVPVFSLMNVFSGHPETLYADACCHINAAGNAILEREILSSIAKYWNK
ncbi:MAG TPA: hypothetical protein VIH99_08660 [Bdellovibrionota bacterium]|jgi:hypothetical protein